MLDESAARIIASTASVLSTPGLRLGDAREFAEGWYFSLRASVPMAGCNGVIVNKRTGRLFQLGSAFPVERDLALYDRGYQFDYYDLTIREIGDRALTIHFSRPSRCAR